MDPAEEGSAEWKTRKRRRRRAREPKVTLTDEQEAVVDLVMRKKSIFLTGNAGTGKTETIKAIVQSLCKARVPFYVTALTGIAACALPLGTTLHSFAGIGLGNKPTEQCCYMAANGKARERWKICRVLIVDEVSMLGHEFFEKLDAVARFVRRCEEPFGGIQLVLCGDFMQLPPIREAPCFTSSLWRRCIDHCVELTKVWRQRDPQLTNLLAEVRLGTLTSPSIALLDSLARPLPKRDVEPTRIYAVNWRADAINRNSLSKLPSGEGVQFEYQATDSGTPGLVEKIGQYTTFPYTLELRVGAQVMMLKNVNPWLVNGSRGVVVGFHNDRTDGEYMDTLVADENIRSDSRLSYPVVEWMNGVRTLVKYNAFTVEEATNNSRAQRVQLPLRLCWAMTVHKSQGMSIDYLEVDLSDVFEEGQAYVALSRARTLDGLRVISYDRNKIRASRLALTFCRTNLSSPITALDTPASAPPPPARPVPRVPSTSPQCPPSQAALSQGVSPLSHPNNSQKFAPFSAVPREDARPPSKRPRGPSDDAEDEEVIPSDPKRSRDGDALIFAYNEEMPLTQAAPSPSTPASSPSDVAVATPGESQ